MGSLSCMRKAGRRYLSERDSDGIEVEVPDDSRAFLTLLRAGSLTQCAQEDSTQSEGQACGLLTLHESEAAITGVVPMA